MTAHLPTAPPEAPPPLACDRDWPGSALVRVCPVLALHYSKETLDQHVRVLAHRLEVLQRMEAGHE